jgi:CRISPR-associated endonuclease/helicase Cas3
VPILAITTQVCELSLDLDCDLLITEFAPISALIQRLGRCCRDQRAHETERTGRVVLYPCESDLPYLKEEMADVPQFVAGVAGRAVSQAEFEERLASLDGIGFRDRPARFIADGPWAAAGQEHFRDTKELTRQAIVPCDEHAYQAAIRSPARWRAQELIVPIPPQACDGTDRPPWMPSWLTFADLRRHEYLPTLGYVAKAGGGCQFA